MNMFATQLRPQFRIAVNSRCGRSCFYCRPSGETVAQSDIELDVNTLIPVAAHLRARGISSVKITGGDPALYQPLEEVIRALKTRLGYRHVEVISRHPLIGNKAEELAEAGLDQINFSLDSVNPETYQKITGKSDFKELESAIRKYVAIGIPVKINTVFMQDVNSDEYVKITRRCEDMGVSTLKFLDVIVDLDQGMPSFNKRLSMMVPGAKLQDIYGDMAALRDWLKGISEGWSIGTQGDLGHPMSIFRLPSGMQVVLKDSHAGAWYGSICGACKHFPCHDALMALRLGPDGNLQCCLLNSDANVRLDDIRDDPESMAQRIDQALSIYETATFEEPSKATTGVMRNA